MSLQNDAVRKWLEMVQSGMERGRLGQSYIVEGDPREEGTAFAEELVGSLMCAGKKKPCGTCKPCRLLRHRSHPDVVWMEPQTKSRRIDVEQIREMERRMYGTPWEGGWKACILVCADRLNDSSANAFLKTLEEPPGKCVFLLLTDTSSALLPTVVSRCQRIPIFRDQGGPGEKWRELLTDVLGKLAGDGGHVLSVIQSRRLIAALQEERDSIESSEKEAAEAAGESPDEDVFNARVSAKYKELCTAILRGIVLWYRDILFCVCGVDGGFLHYGECERTLREAAKGLRWGAAVRRVEIVESAHRQFQRNLNMGLVLDSAFVRMGFGA